jgi:hypothetical protein
VRRCQPDLHELHASTLWISSEECGTTLAAGGGNTIAQR